MSATTFGSAFGSTLRGICRAAGLGVLIGGTLLLYPIVNHIPRRHKLNYAMGFFKIARWIFGIKLEVRGIPSAAKPTLFVSNHSSYLDIILFSTAARASFIAKGEIEGWPLINRLCELQDTVFIARRADQAAAQRDLLRGRLEEGDNLVLFAEGTTSDGNRVLPFKSSLFASVMQPTAHGAINIQPVSIFATELDGMALGRDLRPLYAWYGDMSLGQHVWPLLKLGQLKVVIEFHPVVQSQNFANRKALSDYCWRQVSAGATRALTGHSPQALLSPENKGQKALAAPASSLAQQAGN
jgi:lyso-ornithine lipid O-acyltransferase